MFGWTYRALKSVNISTWAIMGSAKRGLPSRDPSATYAVNCRSGAFIITSWTAFENVTIFGRPKEGKWRIFVTCCCGETKFRQISGKVTKFRHFLNLKSKIEVILVFDHVDWCYLHGIARKENHDDDIGSDDVGDKKNLCYMYIFVHRPTPYLCLWGFFLSGFSPVSQCILNCRWQ